MSDSSLDDTFYDAVEKIASNKRHSTDSDTNIKKYHRKNNSISFEEYNFGYPLQKNNSEHIRIKSWSEHSLNSSIYSFIQRNSLDSSIQYPLFHELPTHGKSYIRTKTKIKANKKFNKLLLAQTLHTSQLKDAIDSKQPTNAIWSCKFSKDGKYLATAGQNCIIHIWKVLRDDSTAEPSVKVFDDHPFRVYTGHTADILDLSWSKNNFLISSSMDKTVRLWHVSQKICLCVFKHLDIVTSARFHPKDDRFFLSGSFDCKVRLWSIPEKRVAFWNEIPAMITAVGFTVDGRTACVGSNLGDVFFFETQGLKYNTQILVKHHRNKRGRKVTGIEPMPVLGQERIIVTTNDSRIWMINMKDKSFIYKYKGIQNPALQIKASFNDDGKFIICGSEDGCVYLWCTDQVNYSPFQYLHDTRIAAVLDQVLQTNHNHHLNWLKRGEKRVIDKLRSRTESFLAHSSIVTATVFAPTKTKQILAKEPGDIIFDHTPVYIHRDDHFVDAMSTYTRSLDDIQTFMDEFVEASPEERQQYDYPDSHIIISSDIHGTIKVWRMDTGVYKAVNNPYNQAHKKSTLSTIFSKFKL